ncbi:uncharacterized protein RSE6_07345 [Rhynchosporium secalis]|uniref:Secreted protein n=1 Tax=Rhynchosporium secalis TaxID=38038 RepID=A0A1E1MCS6_RHYSE|nr:uncharacterized protein RSE6_07345 [Rhynchosporium secalis]
MPGWSRFTIALCIPPFLGPPLPILVLSESSAYESRYHGQVIVDRQGYRKTCGLPVCLVTQNNLVRSG